jgi:hypothetical protein
MSSYQLVLDFHSSQWRKWIQNYRHECDIDSTEVVVEEEVLHPDAAVVAAAAVEPPRNRYSMFDPEGHWEVENDAIAVFVSKYFPVVVATLQRQILCCVVERVVVVVAFFVQSLAFAPHFVDLVVVVVVAEAVVVPSLEAWRPWAHQQEDHALCTAFLHTDPLDKAALVVFVVVHKDSVALGDTLEFVAAESASAAAAVVDYVCQLVAAAVVLFVVLHVVA